MFLDGRLAVNDVHSRLNPTLVHRIVPVDSAEAVRTAVQRAGFEGRAVCVAGGRHAMGAQQFGSGAVLLDTRRLNRVLDFDAAQGTVEVEAGILWPELIRQLLERQSGLGDCTETDRCRSSEPGGRPRGERSWPGPGAEADRGRHRVVQARQRQQEPGSLQPPGECRAVSPCDWRLWSVWSGLFVDAASRTATEAAP